MIVQQCNGVIQVVLDTVNSVQLKLKKLPIMMTDETRERQLLQPSSDQQDQQDQKIDPFSNEILLTISDWIILTLGTIFLLPLRTIGVVLVFCLAYVVAKIGLIGLTAEEIASNVGRQGWRRKLMSWYASFGILIFWAAGFRVKVKGRQVSREEAPILVAAPHSSFMEGLIIYMCGSSPVSRHENQTAFLISACQLFYQAIFVDRYVYL
jgi:lysophospholipid acyltransferase